MAYLNEGGFMSPVLSPPPSTAGSSAACGPLPRPRHVPLKLGSSKETLFINGVDQRILRITRMFAVKHPTHADQKVRNEGYTGFKQAANDIEKVVDLVWLSGTPSLQIPYLLNLAGLAAEYIPAFISAPRPMFRLLSKLDYAFASLLQGEDLETGARLPGFTSGGVVSATDKVRIKSLIDRTRDVVVLAMNKNDFEPDDEEHDQENDDELDMPEDKDDDMESVQEHTGDYDDTRMMDVGMEMARVYDRTLVELGDTLGGPSIGI